MNNSTGKYLPAFIRKKLEGRTNLQKILANTGWLFFDKILRMGVGLIVGVWVARYLGPEQFGALNFAIAFAALFGAIASLGLDGIVVRDIVREPERSHEIISSAFILKLAGGTTAFLFTLAAIFVMRPAASQTHWLVGIIAAGMIFQSVDAIDLWFQSQVQSKYTVLAKNGAFVLMAVVRVILILHQAPLVAFAYAALAEIILGACGLMLFYFKQHVTFVWRPTLDTARRLVKESWPLILSSLAVMIYMRIDQIMLSQMMGDREVGLYSAALRFSEIWYFIPTAIVSSVMPTLTELHSQSEKLYLQRLQQLFTNLVKIAYLIAVPMTFVSTFLVTMLYGPQYKAAGTILSIHIWSAVFVFLGVGMYPWIINEGFIKLSLIQTVCGAIINVAFNSIFIPKYGGVGAAMATLISQFVASFFSNLTLPSLRVIFRMQMRALVKPI